MRLYGLGILIGALLGVSTPLTGGISELSPTMPSKVYFTEVDGKMRPVIGVKTSEVVKVLLSNQEVVEHKYKTLGYQEKPMAPVGRLTILEMESQTERNYLGGNMALSKMINSRIYLKLVADRPLEDVYLVIEYTDDTNSLMMGPIGDIPAGEVFETNVVFHNIGHVERAWYRPLFFSDGYPIEIYRIGEVAGNVMSRSLMIPWDARLKGYLSHVKGNKKDKRPRPFEISIPYEIEDFCRERNLEQLMVTISVRTDGSVHLAKADEQLDPAHVKILRSHMPAWKFFPAVAQGQPIEKKVKIPLNVSL